MRLHLLTVGRMKDGPERELLRRYLDRAQAAARGVGLTGVVEVELDESRSRQGEQRRQDEAEALKAKLPAGARVLLLDERGRSTSSAALAEAIGKARDGGQEAFCFVVGGPDGFARDLLTRHETLSFGAATFPHQLVRVLVAEQMYRAITILAGHPYHRV